MKPNEWTPGSTIRVGFLTLTVVRQAPEKRTDRYLPVPWLLEGSKGRTYLFTPYNGLERVS